MRHNLWGAALAVAVAAALVLGALLVIPPSPQSPAPSAARTPPAGVLPPNALSPSEFAYLTEKLHVPVPVLEAMTNAGLTPAQITAACGLSCAESLALDTCMGCVFAAYLAGLSGLWPQNDGNAISNAVELKAITGVLQQALNQWNETSANAVTLESTLNLTQYAMSTAADSAALSQLGNTTFSAPLDMAQSPVPFNLASAASPIVYEEGAILESLTTWFCSTMCTGGVFAGTSYFVSDNGVGPAAWSGGLCNGGTAAAFGHCAMTANGNASGIFTDGSLTAAPSGSFYLARGATVGVNCASGGSLTIPTYDGRPSIIVPSGGAIVNWSGPGDVFNFGGSSSTGGDCMIGGLGMIPFSGGGVEISSAPAGVTSLAYLSTSASVGTYVLAVSNNPLCVETVGAACSADGIGGVVGSVDAYGGVERLLPALQNIVANAENNARVYWTYLRDLGYTAPSKVPADCTIPMPAFSLPPSMADQVANLTYTQQYSFYLAWINSLATFFDTAQNATTFCTGHPIYGGPGNSTWSDLNTKITGFIYVPGYAWSASAGLVKGTPVFGNTSRWTFNGSSPTTSLPKGPGNGSASVPIVFTGWPTIARESIPIGKAYEIPSNDPTVIIPLQYAAFLTLTGNGTAVTVGGSLGQVSPLASTAGDALYVTSCTIGGVVQAGNCTLSYATINGTLPNINCGNCSLLGSGSGSTFGGLPNPFTWLSDLLGGLFGGGSLGSFLGSLVAGLVILAVLAILVYVAVIEVEAWGSRKRGGGAGGGGSTVVVTGGR